MKKILVLFVLVINLFATSCDLNFDISTDDVQADWQIKSNEFMVALQEKNAEKIYGILSEKAKSNTTDEEIQKVFEYFYGDIVSYDAPKLTGGGGDEVRNGKTVWKDRGIDINNVKTDKNNTYTIHIQYIYVSIDDPTRKGVDIINIYSSPKNFISIGKRKK